MNDGPSGRPRLDLQSILRSLPLTAFEDYLSAQRWYGGKADTLVALEVPVLIPFETAGFEAFLFIVRTRFASGRVEQYALPMVTEPAGKSPYVAPESVPLLLLDAEGKAGLTDALEDKRFDAFLLECIRRGISIEAGGARLVATPTTALDRILGASGARLEPSVIRVEQSNTSIRFGGKLMLKFLRRVEEGVNLDVEMGLFLTERAHFEHTPPVAGSIELQGKLNMTLAVLQGFVENQGDAWKYTLQTLEEFFSRTASLPAPRSGNGMQSTNQKYQAAEPAPPGVTELIGPYLDSAYLLGRRTAELHCALCSDRSDPAFAPEPFRRQDRQCAAGEMDRLAAQAFRLLDKRLEALDPPAREKAALVLLRRREVLSRFRRIRSIPVTVMRTRVHGDYHLGQVLFTGGDFVIIDFEGEPERPLAARRAKRSPLRDVAGMLRSFHYAERTALKGRDPLWGKYWRRWVSDRFMLGYLAGAGSAGFVPKDRAGIFALLDIFLLEKAVYELIYEIRNRPAWAPIPLDGILDLLG